MMSKLTRNYLITALAAMNMAIFSLPVHAQAPLQAAVGNGPYNRPQRMENLGYLTPGLYSKGLSSPQWTEVLLTWLVEERSNPTPTLTGGGGGSIDSGYIQAQIIKALSVEASPQVLDILVASPQLQDEDIRDAIRLALARMGDIRQIKALRRILAHHPEPDFRALAAGGCQDLGVTEAIPDLQHALKDDFSAPAANCMRDAFTFYPVREAAAQALRVIHQLDFVASAHERSRKFMLQLEEERKSAALSQPLMKKLIATVNKSKQTRIARSNTPKC